MSETRKEGIERLTALTREVIEEEAGFSLVMTFTGFARENDYISPDLHNERERLTEQVGENNVLPSFYISSEGIIELGLFVRTENLMTLGVIADREPATLTAEAEDPLKWQSEGTYTLVALKPFVISREEVRALLQNTESPEKINVIVLDLRKNKAIAPSAVDELIKISFGEKQAKELVVIRREPNPDEDSMQHAGNYGSKQLAELKKAMRIRFGEKRQVTWLRQARNETSLLNGSPIHTEIMKELYT